MSTEFAIAAVTIALHNLLEGIQELKNDPELIKQLPEGLKPSENIEVITLPLDAAYTPKNKGINYVNLFLYNVEHSAAWRNMDLPGRAKQGETGLPPLALNLYYIITAHGQNDDELIGHLLLGKAMSILHDHPLLGRDELKTALQAGGLHNQIERLRITPQPISLDEISKLWTGFQTQYRLSAAYEVSVVLIESKRPARTPLPVLTRGGKNAKGDEKGVFVQPGLIPPYPTLETVTFPGKREGALLGDLLTFTGHHLVGDDITMRFSHPHLEDPLEIFLNPGDWTEKEIKVTLPVEPDKWPAGFYTVTAFIENSGGQDRTTNGIPLMLMPSITFPITFTTEASPVGYRAAVDCSPKVLPDQNASLLLGDREIPADSHSEDKTDKLTFFLADVSPGEKYFVRLRIDGVDSPLIDRTKEPPVFIAECEETIP
jgi:hypothetical protein